MNEEPLDVIKYKYAIVSHDSTDDDDGLTHYMEIYETKEEAEEEFDKVVGVLSNVYLVEIIEPGDLIVGIYKYKGKDPKLGLTRHAKSYKTDEPIIMKSGRLNWDDVQYLDSIWEEIKQTMEEN
jgi:hypothetical protein